MKAVVLICLLSLTACEGLKEPCVSNDPEACLNEDCAWNEETNECYVKP